jgi:hypothetical protein
MRSDMKVNSEKLNLIPACTRKRSLSWRHQISLSVYHSSHLKCFQIMNIQIVEFDCYLRERSVPILPSSIKCQLVRFYFHIFFRYLSRTIKPKNKIKCENKFWKFWFLLALENGLYHVITELVHPFINLEYK